jgi:prepilin-type N-terminal cleavage/methylation domain-containing protein
MKINKIASKGFSLVEMLVVIAIIGVIAAIAVPQIADVTSSAETSKNKRNAKSLSSVCAAAQAAGLDFVNTLTDTGDVVDAIVNGSTVSGGAFNGKFFGVPSMSDTDKTAAEEYLSVADGVLRYDGKD